LGPYVILKNSLLFYKIDTRSRRVNSVHIPLLKEYVERDEPKTVMKVTTVLKLDTKFDSMDHEYTKVVVLGR